VLEPILITGLLMVPIDKVTKPNEACRKLVIETQMR